MEKPSLFEMLLAIMAKYPKAKWAGLIGISLMIFGGKDIGLLGSYIIIGVGIFTLVMIFFICELLDDEDKKEREQRKYYKSQFSNKHISKSEFSQRKGVGSQYIKPSPNSTESLNTSSQKIVEANEVISSKPMNGNINCKCGYGDSHRNFLPSDAGDLFKKCPKCNSHIQVLSPSSTLGPHKCINCGYPGVAGAFFASSAGSHYLECPKCNTHFEK